MREWDADEEARWDWAYQVEVECESLVLYDWA